jgi:hypothetical protein
LQIVKQRNPLLQAASNRVGSEYPAWVRQRRKQPPGA